MAAVGFQPSSNSAIALVAAHSRAPSSFRQDKRLEERITLRMIEQIKSNLVRFERDLLWHCLLLAAISERFV